MVPFRKPRRLTFSTMACPWVMSGSCRGRFDGGRNALIAPASADIAAHGIVDLGFQWVLICRKKCCGLHDLPSLAIAALRHVQSAPSLLHRMVAVAVEAFNRRHRATTDIANGGDTRAGSLTIDMDRAGAAQCGAAAILGSGEPQFVPQIPKQRHRRVTVERLLLPVDAQLDHG